jgi:hypothetical protein
MHYNFLTPNKGVNWEKPFESVPDFKIERYKQHNLLDI